MTTSIGTLIGGIYDLPERKLMGLAVKLKHHPDECRLYIPDLPMLREAFEKVLDIRGPERERVAAFYRKRSGYPKIMNKRDLRCAYGMLGIVSKGEERVSEAFVISLKCAIREYTNRPESWHRIVKDNGMDGYVELVKMPRFDSYEEAEEYFKECILLECRPSPYDCTGQRFTTSYKLFERNGRWWAYHSVGVDV